MKAVRAPKYLQAETDDVDRLEARAKQPRDSKTKPSTDPPAPDAAPPEQADGALDATADDAGSKSHVR